MKKDSNIFEELAALNAGILQNAGNSNFYTVPDGYFNSLDSHIAAYIKIKSIPAANLFFVPENYFNSLSESILNKIHADDAVGQFTKKNTFSVPYNYFENLPSTILQRIKKENNNIQQELEKIAPLLSSIPKTNVYSTPEDYFENLPTVAPAKVQPAKVVSFGTKTRRLINYAVAACVAFVLFGGGYLFMNNSVNDDFKFHAAQLKRLNVQNEIAQLSDEQIDNYLSNNRPDIYIQTDENKPSLDIQSLLDNTSDQEIENYLIKNADPGEPTKGS